MKAALLFGYEFIEWIKSLFTKKVLIEITLVWDSTAGEDVFHSIKFDCLVPFGTDRGGNEIGYKTSYLMIDKGDVALYAPWMRHQYQKYNYDQDLVQQYVALIPKDLYFKGILQGHPVALEIRRKGWRK